MSDETRVDVIAVLEHAETILRCFGYTYTANNIGVVSASIAEMVASDNEYDAAQAEQDDNAKFDENGMYVPRAVFDRMKSATARRSAALANLGAKP